MNGLLNFRNGLIYGIFDIGSSNFIFKKIIDWQIIKYNIINFSKMGLKNFNGNSILKMPQI